MEIKERYINPFTDFGFKKLFATEFNKELLIDFLNHVLGDRERVQDLTYLNTENLGNTETDRKAIFDLYCENEKGEKFIIELQNVRQQNFKDRSIFYATFPIQSQAPKGKEWDYYLKAVYTIGVLNFSFPDPSNRERYIREVQLIDKEIGEIFYEKLMFIYLEMPRFKKEESELVSQFDKWMYVLKNLHRLQDRPVKLQEKVFQKLFSEAEIAKLNVEDMKAYEESLKIYRDNYSIIETAKKEGKDEGMVDVAKEMKKDGHAVEMIVKYTGLTKERIEKL
ncbi:Rpn family recombination-promoting nuclease/putative transposase [Lunatibacter salilacus]|uniref:Rpn family recombination-promoting nuclease/putative transposase n=1 Tax=Lunatibacter salilacus TaxID=2483804 RepID=UPI00131E9AA5|nr:Rpn family recombination-promoting nuclease/putative transposase [Lunatibacter salilacus]